MIKATDIKKSYGSLLVLKGINFEAKEAEVLSIVGASGAGKSSLLQILGTLSRPDSALSPVSLSKGQPTDYGNRGSTFGPRRWHRLGSFVAGVRPRLRPRSGDRRV